MRRLIRLMWYVRPYWPQLFASIILFSFVGLLEAFRLALFRPIFDRVLTPGTPGRSMALITIPGTTHTIYLEELVPSHFHNPWTVVAVALVASVFLKGIFDYVGNYLVSYAGFGLVTDLRNEVYGRVLRRSAAFFQKHPTGTLVSAIINDIDKVQFAMSSVLAEFLQQFFAFAFMAGLVISVGGKLAWVLLFFVPLIILSSRKIGRQVRSSTRRGQDKLAEIQNILHETLTGNRIVKAFSTEIWETLRFKAAAERLFSANMRSVVAMGLSSPLMDLLGAVAIALLIKLGRDSINRGTMTIGGFMVFIGATMSLYQPVRKFALFYNNFQQALGASESVFKFMDLKDEVHERVHPRKLPPFRDSIQFEDVRFGYNDGEDAREVLKGINLNVNAGEVVAIVGGSGAGKSTMVHLIPRFFDVTGGRILVDGIDIRDVSVSSLRKQVGIVAQETVLFNDTVRNNIAYGQPHVSQKDVVHAAQAALAHDFIEQMPDGYNTVIGERGFRLSGGERQRLSIARALLKNAPVLILDEATSALDSESEALVQAALQNLMTGRTVFVIAHRLSTVRRADRIIILENGMIADEGSHDDLLTRLGTYRRLYDLQFVDLDAPKQDAFVEEE
ncbi:MAG: multidrug ABC transporter ATP-binding protein [Acidobacteria bacterium]|nr:MAG: multidrug ABC transporter ATP-binding protein [Acidobacteriota bacterium]